MKKKNLLDSSLSTKLLAVFLILLGLIYAFNILTTLNMVSLINEKVAKFEEANKPVELELVTIIDSACSDCPDLTPLSEQFKQLDSVELIKDEKVEFSSQKAKDLINRIGIKKVPTIVALGDIGNEKLSDLWSKEWKKGGGKEKEEWAYFEAVPAPYIDTATGQAVGFVSSTMIIDSSCSKCFPIEQVQNLFERIGVKFSEKKTIEFDSQEAKELIKAHGIQSTPSYIVSNNVLEYPSAKQFLEQQLKLKETNGYFALHSSFPPFKNLETGEITGLVDVIYLDDESCEDCFDVSQLEDALFQMGVAVNSESTLDVSSEEGKQLAEKYLIEKVPTMILSPDASFYVSSFWERLGSVEKDDWHVMRKPEAVGNYKNLAAKEASVQNEKEIVIEGSEFEFSPSSINVLKGEKVKINFKNTGGTLHDFFIEELGVKTGLIAPGNSETIEFVAEKTGNYSFYCTVPGHKEAGMTGKLKVS